MKELFSGSLFKLDTSHPNLTMRAVNPSLSTGLLSNKPDVDDSSISEKSDKKNIFLQFLSTTTKRFVYVFTICTYIHLWKQ